MPQTAGEKKWTPQRVVQIIRWCAVAVALIGLLWSVNTALFILRSKTAEATVVDWDMTTSKGRNSSNGMSETHHFWYAIVELRDEFGAVHRGRSPRGLNERRWERGAKVPVCYDPKNPSTIFIRDLFDIWFPPGIITAFGVAFLLGTSLILEFLRRRAQRNADDVAAIVAKYITKKK
ncbi:MAG: DUF3592 domain-containing protein [Prosthecobacter sp.]